MYALNYYLHNWSRKQFIFTVKDLDLNAGMYLNIFDPPNPKQGPVALMYDKNHLKV